MNYEIQNLGPRIAKSFYLINIFAQSDYKFLYFIIQKYYIISI